MSFHEAVEALQNEITGDVVEEVIDFVRKLAKECDDGQEVKFIHTIADRIEEAWGL